MADVITNVKLKYDCNNVTLSHVLSATLHLVARMLGLPQITGTWKYSSGSFNDTHVFLPGGTMGNTQGANWSINGGKLIVRWPNGWVNIYTWVPGATTLSGFNQGPNGENNAITLIQVPSK